MSILDLFAGTGGLGIEALSRGAGRAVFVDNHPQSQQLIRKNLHLTGFTDRAQQLTADVVNALQRLAGEKRGFDIIFIDPPYHEEDLMHMILQQLSTIHLTTDHGLIVFETGNKTTLMLPDGLVLLQRRTYGDTAVHYITQAR
jgi:16S rRNA (guanine(966)-N(2))-methyltransferase RsmD